MFRNQGDLPWCCKEQGRSQSPRSSDEAGNDRGAKGGRKVEVLGKRALQDKLPRVPQAKQGRATKRACNQTLVEKPRKRNRARQKDLCLDGAHWVNLLSLNPNHSASISAKRPLTGKPDAGNPPVRFGGRGRVDPRLLPLSLTWPLRGQSRQNALQL